MTEKINITLCPVPENEAQRLIAVRNSQLLDTAPEVEFDVTTRIASHLFDLPIALVALMDDDRLWFKSRYGIALEELDRKIAFCAHTILQSNDLMVIEDLKMDVRFVNNPLVHGEPGIRFYAGAPLRTVEGLVLGTIAVLGMQPRVFDGNECALLRDLSVSVMTAIERRARALDFKRLAMTDSLTGLANRIQFQVALSLELQRAATAEQYIAVLYMDLDGFKSVNDQFGHSAGDAVLQEFSRRMLPQLRVNDTLARLGGDEFGIVMCGGVARKAAVALAERIIEVTRAPFQLPDGMMARVGISVGIAFQPAANIDAVSLTEQADKALYKVKSRASHGWTIFGQPDVSDVVAPFAIGRVEAGESEVCSGCINGTAQPFPFSMAFQPIVSVSRRNIFAYEALVRGVNGEPAATVLDRVNQSNRYSFDQSCRRTAIELATNLGIVATGACLSINFMPGAMYEPANCVRVTLAAARRCGLPLDRLIFEVTEGEQVTEPARLANIFKVYREHGFKPAIDDFGAGYAGLNLLAEFQPDIIKLDRQLLENIDLSLPKQAIVRGVLSVCRDLNITPIAEGVETVEEYRILRQLGLDLFQGYLFARPGFEALPVPVFQDD